MKSSPGRGARASRASVPGPGGHATRYDLGVWSEQEAGDWEACVAASYLMGLVYGGVVTFPLGLYTQAEREALEATPDEPQDYATTDAMALERYGVRLRPLSTGTIEDAVTRTGVGLVLTGYGGLLIPTNASIHSLFYLPTSPTAGLLYDPLAANQSAGVPVNAGQVAAWAAGRAGPNQVREVRDSEFLAPPAEDTSMDLKGTNPRPLPEGSLVHIVAGGYLVADPTAMPYTNMVELAVGTPLNVDWQVAGNEILGTTEWFGGWVFTTPPKFGYASLGLCGPLESTIPPPEPTPEPPEPPEPPEEGEFAARLMVFVAILTALIGVATLALVAVAISLLVQASPA